MILGAPLGASYPGPRAALSSARGGKAVSLLVASAISIFAQRDHEKRRTSLVEPAARLVSCVVIGAAVLSHQFP